MRKPLFFFLLTFIVLSPIKSQPKPPFKHGFNLTMWMQQGNEINKLNFGAYGKKDIENIKLLGADVIRLPINLNYYTSGSPNYTIDPLLYFFLDKIVDWAEELQLHLILDNHTFDPSVPTPQDIGDILVPIWKQMAEHYKDRSNLIYYEILNEPHGISEVDWNKAQQRVIDAIREIDSKHTIIIGGSNFNSYNSLEQMPDYEDKNLIYTYHFYDPFLFTHQGASWSTPSMDLVKNIPFPYNEALMPAMPSELENTWLKWSYNDYKKDGKISEVRRLMDIASNFSKKRNVPIFCGEFGAFMINSAPNDRIAWYVIIKNYLDQLGISWTAWDYKGGFGIFNKNSLERFEYDVNIPMINALGFAPPPQKFDTFAPDSSEIVFYDDYLASQFYFTDYGGGELKLYETDSPKDGDFYLTWDNSDRYGNFSYSFKRIKDFSYLVSKGFALDFWFKGSKETRFEIRFVDTKLNSGEDHPWRNAITIDKSEVKFDGTWQHVQIPLNDFSETGSWDNEQWYSAQGKFDWKEVISFQVVAEHNDLKGIKLSFDNIKIVDPNATSIIDEGVLPNGFQLYQNYPNPFNPTTNIEYYIPKETHVSLKIYNTLGEIVSELVNENKRTGLHSVAFNALNLSSGVYFYKIETPEFSSIKKLIFVK
ncbi:MAG: cellulase family glycosylhydrolase [Melioribacteraceae bacterium]|nr:cellulase family glycosylhydrolase [Melioribacteraceae bacterium]